MSNFLAIATVTATLCWNLQNAVGADVNSAVITAVRPDADETTLPSTGINVFLYQVTPNAYWRNSDLPTRRSDASLTQRPRVALDLHYLLTFYGDDSRLETQLLLGSAARTLHAQPIITQQQIQDMLTLSPFRTALASTDLINEIETVKLTPQPLSLEELSRLWSFMFQTTYVLSATYMASVVLIEPEDAPQSALPVQETKVYAVPFAHPTITTLEPAMIEYKAGSTVSLLGSGLRGTSGTIVQFNGLAGTIVPPPGADRLLVTLPANVQAGINTVQVQQPLQLGDPATAHPGFESNLAALIIQPVLLGVNFAAGSPPTITADIAPTVAATQQISLLLNQYADPAPSNPLAYTIQARTRHLNSDPVIFDVPMVSPDTYLVRVRVDGADSNLQNDANNRYSKPTVVVT